MSKINLVLLNTRMFALSCAFLLFLAVAHLWPASYWLDVEKVQVADSKAGAPVLLIVDRTIHREFFGEWSVTIKRLTPAGYVNMHSVTRRTVYKADAALPEPLTLEWWTDGVYQSLPAGTYHMTTTWTVLSPFGVMPDRRVVSESNIFKVTP